MVKRKSNSTRKQRKQGGARGENLKFRYTTNPLRAGWTEAIYPLAPFFLQIPAKIPWSSYVYEGPTQISLMDLDAPLPKLLSLNNNDNNNKNKNKRKQTRVNVNTNINSNVLRSYSVKATPNVIPYSIFGGSACELYNNITRNSSFKIDDLHKTTDPTGDMDVQLVKLNIELLYPQEIEPVEKDFVRSVMMYDSKKGNLSAVYDHYTSWLFDRIVELVTPISKQLPSPEFFPKVTQGNSELVNADKIQQVGNLLVTRGVTNNMIKIQCGVGVNTPSGPIQDHIFEFVYAIDNIVKLDEDTNKTPDNLQLNIYKMTVSVGGKQFTLFVQDPVTLLNGQTKGFVDRIHLRNNVAIAHKLYNHYGRIVFCLQLLLWARVQGIPPSKYSKDFFPYLNRILDEGLLDLTPSPCPKGCDKKFITDLYEMILTI